MQIIIIITTMNIKTTTYKLLPHVYNSNYYFKFENWNYMNETLLHLHIIPFNVKFTILQGNINHNFTVRKC